MLPPKIAKHIQDAKRRYEAFDPKKEAFTFFFITDVHTGGNKNYQQYDFLFDAAKTLPAHLLVNGGDLGLDCGKPRPRDICFKQNKRGHATILGTICLAQRQP